MTPFFIIGAQRSGTTLLRLILNSHPKIAIPEEGTFWMPLLRSHHGRFDQPMPRKALNTYLRYIQQNDQFRAWKMDPAPVFECILRNETMTLQRLMVSLYAEYARVNNKPYWGDKTPSFFRKVADLSRIFPGSKFIHMVRDGRDVFLSMRARVRSRRNIAVSSLEWQYKIRRARTSLSNLGEERSFELKYENLVRTPERELTEICNFLGVTYEKSMLDFWKSSANFIGLHHSSLIFTPITEISVGKWKKELTLREKKIFELVARDALETFKYETISSTHFTALDKLEALTALLGGLPVRAFQVLITALDLHVSSVLGLRTSAAGGERYRHED